MQILNFLEELNKLDEELVKNVPNIEFDIISTNDYEDCLDDVEWRDFVCVVQVRNKEKDDSDVFFILVVGLDDKEVELTYSEWYEGGDIIDVDASGATYVEEFIYKSMDNRRITREQVCEILGCSDKELESIVNNVTNYVLDDINYKIYNDVSAYVHLRS